jgi:thiol-disulfide isomerase/thioredoxin
MRSVSVYAVVAIAAAGLGFAIFQYGIAPRLKGEEPQMLTAVSGPLPGAVTGTADSPTPQSDAAAQPAMPSALPEFSLRDRDGNLRSIGSWTGKSMIVNFWATWCGPCRREIPLLKQIQEQQAAAGFQVVGVAVDEREEVLGFAEQIGINYPLLIGEQDGMDAAIKFGQASIGFPFTAFTDQQHRIVAFHQGELTRPQADVLLGVIGKLNRGELTLEAARSLADEQLAALPG